MDIKPIVEVMLEQHTGGKQFFEALDEALRCPAVYEALYNMTQDPFRYTYILTGKFGEGFLSWMNQQSKPRAGYILFPGDLRDGVAVQYKHLHLTNDSWYNKAVFIDDSIYSGMTRAVCLQLLTVPADLRTVVAYDGMLPCHDYVHSLYRYHDKDPEEVIKTLETIQVRYY
jgi:hypothetical protein